MELIARSNLWIALGMSLSVSAASGESFKREDRLAVGVINESGEVYAPFCIKRAPVTNKCRVVRLAHLREYAADDSALVRSRFNLESSTHQSGAKNSGTIQVDGLVGSEFSPAMIFAQLQFLEAAVTKLGTREIARNLYRYRAVEWTWQDAIDRKKAAKYPEDLRLSVHALFSAENNKPTLIRNDLLSQIIDFTNWHSADCNLFPVIEKAVGGRKGANTAKIAQDYHEKFHTPESESDSRTVGRTEHLALGSGLSNGSGQYLKPICLDWTENGCRKMRFELISPAGSNGSAQTDRLFSRLDLSHLSAVDEKSLEAVGKALSIHTSEWSAWRQLDFGASTGPELSGVEWAQVLGCKEIDSVWRKAIRDSLNQGENWTLWSEAKPLSRKDFKGFLTYLSGDFRHQLYNCGVQR